MPRPKLTLNIPIRKTYENSLFHGSRSASLIAFTKVFIKSGFSKGSLIPTQQLMKKNFIPFSGEFGNSFYKRSVNRDSLSATPDPSLAKHYSSIVSNYEVVKSLSEICKKKKFLSQISGNRDSLMESSVEAYTLMIKAEKLRMTRWFELDEQEKKIVGKQFPIIYAFKEIPPERLKVFDSQKF